MDNRILSASHIEQYAKALAEAEKSEATTEKYLRDCRRFAAYCGGEEIDKNKVIAYKQSLIEAGYAVRSINSMLAAVNSFLVFLGWEELRVRALKLQRQTFCPEEKELSREEYERLCIAARDKHNECLYLILQTICATGIRVSELRYITVEAVRRGVAEVCGKTKIRPIFLVKRLQKNLLRYVSKQGIKNGPVFVTRMGQPMNRTSIWREMKNLCEAAKVDPGKVYPHNLRHLFARIFYGIEKDLAKLADILGHSSINTTRIYIMSTGREHREEMEHMHLII